MSEILISNEIKTSLTPNTILVSNFKKEWNSKMAPYISTEKYDYNILSFSKLSQLLIIARYALKKVLENNGNILIVGTSKLTSSFIKSYSLKNNFFYINYRWLGGTLTNWKTIQSQILQLKNLEKEIFNPDFELLSNKLKTKKLNKFSKLSILFNGIKNMKNLPDLLIFTNPRKDFLAIKEALHLGIPIISLVDTKCDPINVTYPIPSNLDSLLSINFILNYLIK